MVVRRMVKDHISVTTGEECLKKLLTRDVITLKICTYNAL